MPLSDDRASSGAPWVSSWSDPAPSEPASAPIYTLTPTAGGAAVDRLLLAADLLVAVVILGWMIRVIVAYWDDGSWAVIPAALIAGGVRLVVRRRPVAWTLLTPLVAAVGSFYVVYGIYAGNNDYPSYAGVGITAGIVIVLAVVLALVLAGRHRADGPGRSVAERRVLAGALFLGFLALSVTDLVELDEELGQHVAVLALIVPAALLGWLGDRAEQGRWIGARGAVLGVALAVAVTVSIGDYADGFVEVVVLVAAAVLLVVAGVLARRSAPRVAEGPSSPVFTRL